MHPVSTSFSLAVEVEDGRNVVRATGEVDLHTAPQLEDALVACVTERPTLLDLSGVTLIDSTGLSALVVARRTARAQGTGFSVEGATGVVHKVLAVTGLDEVLGVSPPPA